MEGNYENIFFSERKWEMAISYRRICLYHIISESVVTSFKGEDVADIVYLE